MKNSKNSLMFPGVNGHNGNNMDTTDTAGFSEGDLLLQVWDKLTCWGGGDTHSDAKSYVNVS